MKRPTIAELQAEIESLKAYREAYLCLRQSHHADASFTSDGPDETTVYLYGAARSSGGVVIIADAPSLTTDWILRARASGNIHLRDLADRVERAQTEIIRRRFETTGSRRPW